MNALVLPTSWTEFERNFAPVERRSLENPNTPISVDMLAGMWDGPPTSASVRVSEVSSLRYSVMWACVRALEETVASLPWPTYKRTGKAKEPDTDNPLYATLHDSPNDLLSSFVYREVLMVNACIYGRFYSYISRRTQETALIVLPPPAMQPVWKNDKLLYELSLAGGEKELLAPDEVIHIPGLSLDGINSMSPVMTAAREAIGLALAAEEHNSRFFSNGARVGGILTTDGTLSPEARERVRAAWIQTQQGLANAYRTAVLEGGIKYQAVGMQADQAQLDQTRRMQVEEVCRIFRMPPAFVQDHTRSTFSNSEQQDIHFAKHTIAPWCKRIEAEFNRKLFPDRKSFCEFNLDGLMRGDFKSRTEGYARALGGPGAQGYMTVDEVRALENLPPIEGGDKLIKAEVQKPKPDKPDGEPA